MSKHSASRCAAATVAVGLLVGISANATASGWETAAADWSADRSADQPVAVRPAAMTSRARARARTGLPLDRARTSPRVARLSGRETDIETLDPTLSDDLDWMSAEPEMEYGGVTGARPMAHPGMMAPVGPAFWFPPLWVRAEYLLWWTKGMDIPPLITTSPAGTLPTAAGVLGEETTEILVGNEQLLTSARSGGRIRFGTWLDTPRTFGLQGEYFVLFNRSETHGFTSDAAGNPILARPFFNINPRDLDTGAFDPPAREDAELISHPNLIRGTATVDASNTLQSAAGVLVWNACGSCFDCCDPSQGVCSHNLWLEQDRVDWLAGFRYANLRENLRIDEDLTSLEANRPGSFQINDQFSTRNEFYGGELGVVHMIHRGRWMLESALKVAVGSTRQTVTIDGGTRFTAPGGLLQQSFPGGLLAQRTNMGTYSRSVFSTIPQIGITAGYRITPRLSATAGYTLFYWNRVARPGDQIDLTVNPDLVPPEADPFTGPLRPQFAFVDSDFWAHGLTAGLDFRW